MKRSKSSDVKVQPKKGQQVLDTIIKNATQQWIRTPVHLRSPLQFLQLSSHCINDTIYYASLEDLKLMKKNQQQDNNCVKMYQKYSSDNSNLYTMAPAATTTATVQNNMEFITTNSSIINQHHPPAQQIAQFPQRQKNTAAEICINANECVNNNNFQQQTIIVKSSDPPPLAFFPKVTVQRKVLSLSSEPPPLVPIGSKR